MPISTASFKKNPFTMSKTNLRPYAERSGYRRRNLCDGKLVAYILEDNEIFTSARCRSEQWKEMVEPIGIEPMT